MPKSSMGKLKLIYILRYLEKHSDEEHYVTVAELISHLTSNGISAERKSIYDDIEALIAFGCDIIKAKEGKTFGYKLVGREFETPEIKLLVNAVEASKFLSAKKSRELIEKLGSLCSKYTAASLRREVYVAGRVKSMNESIYRIIDVIHSAIAEDKSITFNYMKYDLTKKQVERRGGKIYKVSPFSLVFEDENYYLLAYDGEAAEIKHYRVDKMANVLPSDEKRQGHERYTEIDPARFTKQVFGMFGGKVEKVSLIFDSRLIDAALDRFGSDVNLVPMGDRFKVITDVAVSPQFFGWLASFGDEVKIETPKSVKEKYMEHIKKITASF